jgi:hypothetical protein
MCVPGRPRACAPPRPRARPAQSKLAALAEEAQAAQAASTSGLEWQGRRHAVRAERVKVALHAANELGEQLAAAPTAAPAAAADGDAAGPSPLEARLALYDRMVNAYAEARGHLRAAAKASTGGCARRCVCGRIGVGEEGAQWWDLLGHARQGRAAVWLRSPAPRAHSTPIPTRHAPHPRVRSLGGRRAGGGAGRAGDGDRGHGA